MGVGPDPSGQGDEDVHVGLTKVTRSSPNQGFSIFKSWSPYLLRAPLHFFHPGEGGTERRKDWPRSRGIRILGPSTSQAVTLLLNQSAS